MTVRFYIYTTNNQKIQIIEFYFQMPSIDVNDISLIVPEKYLWAPYPPK
jgi:hypothetical protein